jgi:divalent metal cation (Fe/Co/Zn/Cd) transporter
MKKKTYLNDNIHKHKKEKMIDEFLEKAEINRYKELKSKVKHYEKIVNIKLSSKKKITIDDSEKKDVIEIKENIPNEGIREKGILF